MKSYRFTIIASGLDHEADDFEDRFFEAGCDDATIVFTRGSIILEFDREARNISHAIASAMENVETAGANVERVEPDYLVSLADIAERSGLTRAAISNYASGGRGKGFPTPIARVSSGSPLWNWVDVARWFRRRAQISTDAVVEARVVKRANDNIEAAREREYA
jgi:transcriptional regulator with XRE-family HTH domain